MVILIYIYFISTISMDTVSKRSVTQRKIHDFFWSRGMYSAEMGKTSMRSAFVANQRPHLLGKYIATLREVEALEGLCKIQSKIQIKKVESRFQQLCGWPVFPWD